MMNSASGGGGGGVMRSSSPFTVSQWQELEHQALIYKYLIAGLPVPPDLVIPIQKSFESISHRFFHLPSLGYCSLYGKKVDPEPGRCRRTDGKKWRCSKEAYPDSKYCERHMHRGRNRSRKPVEPQTATQSSSSTVTSLTVTGSSGRTTGTLQNFSLHSFGNVQGTASSVNNQPYYNVESIPFGIPSKDYRYASGMKPEVSLGEHSFFSDASGNNSSSKLESPFDNAWPPIQTRVSSFPTKSSSASALQNEYPQPSFFNIDFALGEPAKQEAQSLRPFLDEWPKSRDSWSGLEDSRSNQTSFSTTQLSISIPMDSDFSGASSRSPQEN